MERRGRNLAVTREEVRLEGSHRVDLSPEGLDVSVLLLVELLLAPVDVRLLLLFVETLPVREKLRDAGPSIAAS